MSERVSDKELQEMLDVMDEGESYLPEEDIESALRDLIDARSGKALKDARRERDEARKKLETLVEQVEMWNQSVEAIIGRQPRTGIDLAAARAAEEER